MKALLTPRFHCLVYDNQYGSEIKDTVTDENATEELIRAEIPRLVEDALLCDGRILKVYDFEFEFNEDSCNVHFTADTIYGDHRGRGGDIECLKPRPTTRFWRRF